MCYQDISGGQSAFVERILELAYPRDSGVGKAVYSERFRNSLLAKLAGTRELSQLRVPADTHLRGNQS